MEVRSLARGLWSSLPECGLPECGPVLGGAWGKLLTPSKPSLHLGAEAMVGFCNPGTKTFVHITDLDLKCCLLGATKIEHNR